MAALVLGAVGSMMFGPIGFLAGSLIGNLLFPTKSEGPRLSNLRLQGSNYGAVIPIIYGTVRLAGQVIAQSDLREHKHKQGGKGGPSVTTYSYSADFAVKICKGPVAGVLRIWAAGTIIYDVTGSSSVDNSKVPVTIYLGEEGASPDPTLEALFGVGNVPAFQDDCVVVFNDWDLSQFGNQIPQLHFEVFTNTTGIPWRVSHFAPYGRNLSGHGGIMPGPSAAMIDDQGRLLLGYLDSVSAFGGPGGGTSPVAWIIKAYDLQGNYIEDVLNVMVDQPAGFGAGSSRWMPLLVTNNPFIAVTNSVIGEAIPSCFWFVSGTVGAEVLTQAAIEDSYAIDNSIAVWSAKHQSVYVPAGDPAASAYIAKWNAPAGVPAAVPSAFYMLPDFIASTWAAAWHTAVDDTTNSVWCGRSNVGAQTSGPNCLLLFDSDLNFVHGWDYDELPAHLINFAGGYAYTAWNDYLFGNSTLSLSLYAYKLDRSTWTFTLTDPGSVSLFVEMPVPSGGNLISLGNGLAVGWDGVFSLNPPAEPVTLASIVSDLSVRAGLSTGDIDVSALSDLVDGYIISTQADCRSQIEPLRTAWFFDAVESNGIAKFVKRGGAPVITIPDSDLAAQQEGESPPPLIEVEHAQQLELPWHVGVKYMNLDASFQDGEQYAQRQAVTDTKAVSSVELAIVMTDAKARQVAHVALYSPWIERDRFKFRTTRKYDYLEPTDVVIAHGYQLRITSKSEKVAGDIEFDGVQTFPSLYVTAPTGVGTIGSGPPPSTGTAQLTELLLLDLPLVKDGDQPNGYYAAMYGAVDTSWKGATLYKSNDGGANYAQVTSATVADGVGATTTALGNFLGGNTFDEINSVTVEMKPGAGTLAGTTALNVLNGANAAVLGQEIFQFKNAVLTAPLTYELSGLLRGRRGTEFAIGGHRIGETFCLLPTSVNVPGPFAEIGAQRDFKAVTTGNALASATDVPFTNSGVALRCYAPVQIGGGLNGSGDLTIQWIRRTRINGEWQSLADAPLSEATEAYIVQIWNSDFSQCARVIQNIFAPITTYTAAQQTTDFGALQSSYFVTVGQVGLIGLGTQTGAELPGAGSVINNPVSPVQPYNNPPPSVPPSGGCTGTVFTDTVTWGGSVRLISPGGFAPGTNWVISMTTPGSGALRGTLSFYEYGGAPDMRRGVLSTSQCGGPLIPAVEQHDLYVNLRFCLGPNAFPTDYATLQTSTTYYFTLQIDHVTGAPAAAEFNFYG